MIITYNIMKDHRELLRPSAKTACNFWNEFLIPKDYIVIHLGTFKSKSRTIARAYKPFHAGLTVNGVVEFNIKYLEQFSTHDIVTTLIHEIGHTLGMGWDIWDTLFYKKTGKFSVSSVAQLPDLNSMFVETDFGPGTQYSHWDEAKFGAELMTGFKNNFEFVLPVTISVMRLLGHTVTDILTETKPLDKLIREMSQIVFCRENDLSDLVKEDPIDTDLMEEMFI